MLWASMGPQHESCGKMSSPDPKEAQIPASMGPQHESCGKAIVVVVVAEGATLQWGRNMRVAESTRGGSSTTYGTRFNSSVQFGAYIR